MRAPMLAALMLAALLCLAACGGGGDDTEDDNTPDTPDCGKERLSVPTGKVYVECRR